MPQAIRIIDKVSEMSDWNQSVIDNGEFVKWNSSTGKFEGAGALSDAGGTISGKLTLNYEEDDQALVINYSGGGNSAMAVSGGNLDVGGGRHCLTATGKIVTFGLGNPDATDKESASFGWDSTAGRFQVKTSAAGTGVFRDLELTAPKVLVKQFSGSGNIFEWQNSSGTVLAKVKNSGNFVIGTTDSNQATLETSQEDNSYGLRVNGFVGVTHSIEFLGSDYGLQFSSSGSIRNLSTLTFFNADANITAQAAAQGGWTFYAPAAASVPVNVRGAASQTANLQNWQNSNGQSIVQMNKDGNMYFYRSIASNIALITAGINANTGNIFVMPYSPSTVGLQIIGAASQTAHLQEWQNNSGTVMAYIRSDGIFANNQIQTSGIYVDSINNSAGNRAIIDLSNGFILQGVDTAVTTMRVKAVASQTANLQEWQNSSGTTVASVDPNGFLTVTGPVAYPSTLADFNLGGYPALKVSVVSGVGAIWESAYAFGATNILGQSLVLKDVADSDATYAQFVPSYNSWADDLEATRVGTFSNNALSVITSARTQFVTPHLQITNNNFYNATPVPIAMFEVLNDSNSKVGVIVKGAASQSASLQEWQNSDGSTLAYVSSSGHFISGSDGHTFGAAQIGYLAVGTETIPAGGTMIVGTRSTDSCGFIVRSIAAQTADWVQFTDSFGNKKLWMDYLGRTFSTVYGTQSGYLMMTDAGISSTHYTAHASVSHYNSGVLAFGGTSDGWTLKMLKHPGATPNYFTNVALIESTDANTKPLVIKACSTRTKTVSNKVLTSNVATLTTSDDHGFFVAETVVVSGVDSTFNGTYTITSVPSTTTFTYAKTASNVTSQSASGTAVASQTVSLQEWQNGSGTVLAKIDASGVPYFHNADGSNVRIAKQTLNGATRFYNSDNGGYEFWNDYSNQMVNLAARGYYITEYTGSVRGYINCDGPGPCLASDYQWGWRSGSSGNLGGNTTIDTGLACIGAASVRVTDGSTGYGALQASEVRATDGTNYAEISGNNGSGRAALSCLNDNGLVIFCNRPSAAQGVVFIDGLGVEVGGVSLSPSAPTAQFKVSVKTAAKIGQIIQAASSQSANLQEWQDENGSIKSRINNNGLIYINYSGTAPTGYNEAFSTDGLVVATAGFRCPNGWNLNMGAEAARRLGVMSGCYLEFGGSDASGYPAHVLDTGSGNTFSTQKLLSIRNAGSEVTAITANGGFKPASMADSAAENGTIYYSTDAGKLVYKDGSGTVNNLY